MTDEQQHNQKKKRVVKSSIIDHSYNDYANAPVQNAWVANDAISCKAPNFPAKLHQIVSTPEYQHIIAWLPHGRSWTIRNKELLVNVVLRSTSTMATSKALIDRSIFGDSRCEHFRKNFR
jgi:hypothetical protein